MQGIVHIIDAVLRPPKDGLRKKTVRHALWGLEAKAPKVLARGARRSCRGTHNVWQQHDALDDAYRDSPVQLGKGRIASKVRSRRLALSPAMI